MVRIGITPVLIAAFLLLGNAPDGHAAKRRAFVAGIDDYTVLKKLSNAQADAGLVATSLELSGFQVSRSVNGTMAELDQDWKRFLNEVSAGDFAVVYFAGHGVQKGGANYLLPADFSDTDATMSNAVRMDRWITDLAAKKPAQKIIILDACRDNPLKADARGLAVVENPAFGSGTYVVFATAPGRVADDGLFARHFVRELRTPGRRVDDVFNSTLAGVRMESGGRQVPFVINSGGLSDRFFSSPDRTEPLRLADQDECKRAIPLLQPLLSDDPDDGAVLWAMGHCQIIERDISNGRRNIERAITRVNLLPYLVNTERAVAAFVDGDISEAKARLQEALRDEPEYPEALILRGRIMMKEREYDEAARIFDGIFQRLRPDSPRARANRITACNLLADAFGGNGAIELERTQRSRCTVIANAAQ